MHPLHNACEGCGSEAKEVLQQFFNSCLAEYAKAGDQHIFPSALSQWPNTAIVLHPKANANLLSILQHTFVELSAAWTFRIFCLCCSHTCFFRNRWRPLTMPWWRPRLKRPSDQDSFRRFVAVQRLVQRVYWIYIYICIDTVFSIILCIYKYIYIWEMFIFHQKHIAVFDSSFLSWLQVEKPKFWVQELVEAALSCLDWCDPGTNLFEHWGRFMWFMTIEWPCGPCGTEEKRKLRNQKQSNGVSCRRMRYLPSCNSSCKTFGYWMPRRQDPGTLGLADSGHVFNI